MIENEKETDEGMYVKQSSRSLEMNVMCESHWVEGKCGGGNTNAAVVGTETAWREWDRETVVI
jgi:hypothetical protein